MTTIEKIFKKLGISNKTYLVYDQVVKNGPILASWLAKNINMPRATVYLYLEELLKLGLISTTGSYKKRRFLAEDPKRLVGLVETRANNFTELIPDAEKAAKSITENLFLRKYAIPEVKYFLGSQGARNVIEASLTCKSKEINGIIAIANIYDILGDKFLQEYTRQRIKKGIRVKNIWPQGQAPQFLTKHKEQLRGVKFSKNLENFSASFITYDDIVIMITSQVELLSVQIKSHDLAQAIKILFNQLWDGSKEV